ncbi:hypothetical protein BDZ91DRAFT_766494 [Kalaharituber pfeilii]|nr:hypothetical protein BDZ91DRAFT_766494 [Kalaharituber pfeilii]
MRAQLRRYLFYTYIEYIDLTFAQCVPIAIWLAINLVALIIQGYPGAGGSCSAMWGLLNLCLAMIFIPSNPDSALFPKCLQSRHLRRVLYFLFTSLVTLHVLIHGSLSVDRKSMRGKYFGVLALLSAMTATTLTRRRWTAVQLGMMAVSVIALCAHASSLLFVLSLITWLSVVLRGLLKTYCITVYQANEAQPEHIQGRREGYILLTWRIPPHTTLYPGQYLIRILPLNSRQWHMKQLWETYCWTILHIGNSLNVTGLVTIPKGGTPDAADKKGSLRPGRVSSSIQKNFRDAKLALAVHDFEPRFDAVFNDALKAAPEPRFTVLLDGSPGTKRKIYNIVHKLVAEAGVTVYSRAVKVGSGGLGSATAIGLPPSQIVLIVLGWTESSFLALAGLVGLPLDYEL